VAATEAGWGSVARGPEYRIPAPLAVRRYSFYSDTEAALAILFSINYWLWLEVASVFGRFFILVAKVYYIFERIHSVYLEFAGLPC